MRSRPEAERAFFAAIDKARAELVHKASLPVLTKEAAISIAIEWFLGGLERGDDWRKPMSPEELDEALELSSDRIVEARQALSEKGEAREWQRRAASLRDRAGYASERSADWELTRLLARCTVAMEEVEQGRLLGDYGRRPSDPLFAAAMEAPGGPVEGPAAPVAVQPAVQLAAAPARSIADLERAFREAKFPTLSPSTVQGYEPVLRLLRDVLGADTYIARLTHDDGQRLFEAVQGLPTNAQKHRALRGLGTLEAIAEGKRLGLPTVSAKTVNDRYMANIGSLFRFAAARGWMTLNLVHGLRANDAVNDRDRRDAFRSNLPKVFGAAPWAPKDASQPLHYWGPLLALFHGLRLGEIAGLLVRDIGEEAGEPMLLLRDGNRPLKTKAARRDIPVHPTLVRLGFLEFVEERREKSEGGELLFAGQKAYARQQWGRRLGEWFGRHVKALGLEGRKLGMHSLRHDFRDALREAEVPEDVAHYLMGHAQEGMGAVYGGRPTLARLKAAIARVAYPGLTLSEPSDG
jgi:integrase